MKLAALRYPLENPVVEAWEILYVAPSWMFMLIKYELKLCHPGIVLFSWLQTTPPWGRAGTS